GALTETVTVTGVSPLVDVQNTKTQTVISEQTLTALPTSTGGTIQLVTLTPGLSGATDVGGTSGLYRMMGSPEIIGYHRRMGAKMYFDGMPINNAAADGNVSYIVNTQVVEEMVLEAGGTSAENASSGFSTNAVPKQGSNRFAFTLNGVFSSDKIESDNIDS